LSVLGMV